MATTDTTAKQLIINKLTTAQFNGIATKDPTQMYLLTDAESSATASELEAVRSALQQSIDDNAGDIAALDADKADKTAIADMLTKTEAGTTYETKADATSKKTEIDGKITAIDEVIPEQASATNQLADKAFVNSTVQTNTANFRGNWATYAAIPTDVNLYPADYAGSKTPTVNDYLVVESDENDNHNGAAWRYKYTGVWATDGKAGWQPEYRINESPFTAGQLAALNSGVTSDTVSQVATNKTDIKNLSDKESEFETTVANTYETKADAATKKSEIDTALAAKLDSATAATTYETKADATSKKTALETEIGKKQDKLTAGTHITIENNVISAEEGLPAQTGNAGKFLTTDGTDPSWVTIDLSPYATTTSLESAKEELQQAITTATNDMLTKTEAGTTYETKADATSKKTELDGKIKTNADDIDTIEGKIPEAASTTNQLADKAFVNSTVQTNSANFRGAWATFAAVPTDPAQYPADYAGSTTPTTNDYMVVLADENDGHNGATWRYKYTGVWATNGKDGWKPEYKVNDTPLTADQVKALNSGVTTDTVAQVATNKTDIAGLRTSKQDALTAGDNISLDGNTVSVVGTLPSARLADGGTAGQALVKTASGQNWANVGDVTTAQLQAMQETLQQAITTATADMLTKTEAGTTYATIAAVDAKLDKNQGAENAGKTLMVATDGNVELVEVPQPLLIRQW